MPNHNLSRLIVSARMHAIPLVCAHACTVAKTSGFSEAECAAVELGMEEAAIQFVELSDDDDATLELVCEPEATQLTLSLRYQGLPLDFRSLPEYDPHRPEIHPEGLGAYLMRRTFDKTRWRNRGKEGQEFQLVKLRAIPGLEAVTPPITPLEPQATPAFTVRRMQPDDALAVSRCIYASYGTSYVHDFVYYPERLAAMNASDELISAVAVTEDGVVLGHAALVPASTMANTGELGIAATLPHYRGGGVARQISEWLLDRAVQYGWHGVSVDAVTSHPYTQNFCLRLGFRACGLLLGLAPSNMSFRGIADQLQQRASCLLTYRTLQPALIHTIYPPPRYQNLLIRIYEHLEHPVRFAGGHPPNDAASQWEITVKPTFGTAILTLHRLGQDAAKIVAGQLLESRRQDIECVLLYLNLSDPALPDSALIWERLGFYFSGMLPGGEEGDWLILGHLLQQTFDYQRLVLVDDWSRELLAAIEMEDPVLRTLAGHGT